MSKRIKESMLICCTMIVLCLCHLCCVCFADPVSDTRFEFTQSNGETIVLLGKGDEYLNWIEDEYGNLVVYSDGDYYYADWSENGPISCGILVSKENSSIATLSDTNSSALAKLEEQANQKRTEMQNYFNNVAQQIRQYNYEQQKEDVMLQSVDTTTSKPYLSRKVLVIYVDWEDTAELENLTVLTDAEISEIFFTGEKSINEYYKAAFDVTNDIIVPANGDVSNSIIRITMPGKHLSLEGEDRFSKIVDSVQAAANNCNFSLFDTNSDGTLQATELVCAVVFHGYSASAGSKRTPGVGGATYGTSIELSNYDNDLCVDGFYCQSSHIDESPTSIATGAHEIGHTAYGFGDQYSEEYNDYRTGYWSLMATGMWSHVSGEVIGSSPSLIDAYSLVNSGIIDPIILEYDQITQATASSPAQIYKITTDDEEQYFLLQNRNKTGIFDMSAFSKTDSNDAGGLLIWHIDENASYVIEAVEEAHGGEECINYSSGGKLSDLWGNDKHAFSKFSDPSSNLYEYRDTSNLGFPRYVPNPLSDVQTIESDVSVQDIYWNSSNKETSFSVGHINVSSNKQFFVTFNYPIFSKYINSDTIYVLDEDNKTVNVTLSIESNNSIAVLPPSGGYETGKFYTLFVSDNIYSLGGNKLENSKKIVFKVE